MITRRSGDFSGLVAAVVALLALSGCKEQPTNRTQGYVEGEFVYVASQIAGTLDKLNVQRGDQVKPGDPLFELDETNELAARDQAKAALVYSEAQFLRQQQLYRKGPAAEMDLDQARSNRDQDKQRLAQAEWSLDQKKQAALVGGLVYDTLYQHGEMVPAGKPVVILLPPPNIKVRTFVPQKWLGGIHYGDAVQVSVDGTSEMFPGKVSYISPHAEYTPPVIYSEESRSKLVYMIEMVFDPQDAAKLHPGQPVQVQFLNNPEGK